MPDRDEDVMVDEVPMDEPMEAVPVSVPVSDDIAATMSDGAMVTVLITGRLMGAEDGMIMVSPDEVDAFPEETDEMMDEDMAEGFAEVRPDEEMI